MTAIFEDITAVVGYTPLVRINKLGSSKATVLGKLESNNPCGSVKDRIALSMIESAEKQGLIKEGTVIIEPTSGNTGIGLAFICAAKGYDLVLTMPESMSIERRKILKFFGAQIVLTPAEEGMPGAVKKAEQLIAENSNSFMPQQFKNPANPQIHRKNKNLKVIGVEPKDSPVLSGGKPGPHKIQGIGAGFVPEVLNTDLIDEVIQVSNEDAIETAKQLAVKEGILAGISAGANVWAAVQVSNRPEFEGKTIITVICDTGERYISTELFHGL
ncbi:MAG: PLP-dependent cysteine synthase family protein [Planctomycetota bacterium]